MVSFTVYKPNTGGAYVEGVCLATDEKPIAGITNGSILFAVDTTDGSMTRYMFDQSAGEWIETECPCSGGGSGGGGDISDYLLEVSVTDLGDAGLRLAASWNELKAAYDAGKFVYLRFSHSEDNGEYWSARHSTLFLTSLSADGGGGDTFYNASFGSGSSGMEWQAEDPDTPMHETAA